MHPGIKYVDPQIRKLWHDSVARDARRKRWHAIEQAFILVLSAVAIAIVNHGPIEWRFYGNVVGLASQPLWLTSTWRHRQWGMFLNAFFYAGIWTAGVIRYY